MSKIIDLSNKKFGKLTVINRVEVSGTKVGVKWNCICDCGTKKIISSQSLRDGKSKSCGCFKKSKEFKGAKKHEKSNTFIYKIWSSIKARCFTTSNKDYPNYGGRGITMCDEWKNDFMSFYNWSIENGYVDHLTIERLDVNANYSPDNCSWIKNELQALNRRNTKKFVYNNETESLRYFSEKYKINYNTLRGRINNYNWDIKKAIEEIPRKGKNQYG